jgi:hypothetical protein
LRVDVTNETKELKVTDKRMFTPEGDLREEYRFLNEKSTAPAEPPPSPPSPDMQEPPAASRLPEPPREAPRRGADADSAARLDFPSTPPGMGPTFFDLAAMLAEPVAIYLGDLELPDGQSAVNLEMARLHIDMLDVLRQKTLGNLSAQESAFLEDLLYRLRVRYVQKRG